MKITILNADPKLLKLLKLLNQDRLIPYKIKSEKDEKYARRPTLDKALMEYARGEATYCEDFEDYKAKMSE